MTAQESPIQRLARAALRIRGLDCSYPPIALGNITLLPHQVAAVHWLRARITRTGGALLADPPGLGKTYVALAVAAALRVRPLIIAPATLRTRWLDAAHETRTDLDFVSTERLSAPTPPTTAPAPLIIIDEAHHLRTRTTRRRQRTAELCTNAQVLLLSATPIHNGSADLEHLTALFHTGHTRPTTRYIRQHLTLRRTLDQIHAATADRTTTGTLPRITHYGSITTGEPDDSILHDITTLPRLHSDTPESHRLLTLGLIHALRSSPAALTTRCEHRIAACLAIEHAVRDHVAPSRAVRRAFASHDGDIQLAMPALLAPHFHANDPELGRSARRQREALAALRRPHGTTADHRRVAVLRRLARWSSHPTVAFTQFTATATALFDRLRNETGIALLHGSAARIATGAIQRQEAIDRLLAPQFRSRHDAIRLLITTDVLSEGLSLSGVATIVHLDLPWTAARIEQRVGRAARIGAGVACVRSVVLPMSVAAEVSDGLQRLLKRKRTAMQRFTTGDSGDADVIRQLCALRDTHAGSAVSARWCTVVSSGVTRRTVVAIVVMGERKRLVAACDGMLRRPSPVDWQALRAGRVAAAPSAGSVAGLRIALRRWQADHELTTAIAGSGSARLAARRAADAGLLRTSRASRVGVAQSVSDARRVQQHTVRPGELASAHARMARAAVGDPLRRMLARPSGVPDRVRVVAGVVLVPE